MRLDRIDGREGRRRGDGREAAVLVPILERSGGYHIVLTKRGEQLTEHAGQMSFPGGQREPVDANPFATAIREADEEIGLREEEIVPIGRLDDITTTTEYVVRPFVSRVPDRTFEPDEREVAEVAILPVDAFLDPTNYESNERTTPSGATRRVHAFSVDGYHVWGATGQLVVQLLELTTDWRVDRAQV